jgi:tryptophan-rich sensory protein
MTKYLSLALWVLAFEAVSFAIGMATQGGVDGWYASLNRPPMVPPNIVFPVMWTILYALIAAAGWHLWRARHEQGGRTRLMLFGAYMALNWSWSFIFFGAHMMLTGFICIILMNMAAILLIVKSWQDVRPASLLLIPPTLWTLFAAYLNGAYWWVN